MPDHMPEQQLDPDDYWEPRCKKSYNTDDENHPEMDDDDARREERLTTKNYETY